MECKVLHKICHHYEDIHVCLYMYIYTLFFPRAGVQFLSSPGVQLHCSVARGLLQAVKGCGAALLAPAEARFLRGPRSWSEEREPSQLSRLPGAAFPSPSRESAATSVLSPGQTDRCTYIGQDMAASVKLNELGEIFRSPSKQLPHH